MFSEISFGEYFKELIKNKGYTFVAFRKEIGLSKTYLVDIEKGNTFPTPEMQIKIAELLNLNNEERHLFYDKAAIGRKEIPADISTYLTSNPEEIKTIRERMRA